MTDANIHYLSEVEMAKRKKKIVIVLGKTGEALAPWSYSSCQGASAVEAYSAVDGKRHVIAQTFDAPGIQSNVTAEIITRAVDENTKFRELIGEMLAALDMCLESGGLTWEAEQEADAVSMKARQIGFNCGTYESFQGESILSPREIEILAWTAQGKTRKDISQLLQISDETVKVYFIKIQRKLHASNKTNAVSIAIALGVLTNCLREIKKTFIAEVSPKWGCVSKKLPPNG